MLNWLRKRYGVLLIGLLVLCAVGGVVTVEEPLPDSAKCVAWGQIYYPGNPVIAATRLEGQPVSQFAFLRVGEAKAAGMQADSVSLAEGYFKGMEISLLRLWLSYIGVSRPSRWDEKGNWRW